MNTSELTNFLHDNYSIIKPKFSLALYIFVFIISFLLTSIIPFMYSSLINPVPMYENAVSTINYFTFINVVQIIVFSLVVLGIMRNSFSTKMLSYIRQLKPDEPENRESNLSILTNSIKSFYRYRTGMLLLLFIPFWGSFITAFMHVTGPLVLSHKIYFLNNIPLVLYLAYIFLTIPTTHRIINYYVKKNKVSGY